MYNLDDLITELTSGIDERANAIIKEFDAFGKPAIKKLAELFDNANQDFRWWAIRTLAEIKSPDVYPHLQKGLNDKNLAVQQCAALALREHPTPSSVPDLMPLLGQNNSMLARLAGDALIAIGDRSTQELIDVAKHGNLSGRIEAVRALALIGDYASVTTLFKLLDDESGLIEHWANEGLARMGIGMAFFEPG